MQLPAAAAHQGTALPPQPLPRQEQQHWEGEQHWCGVYVLSPEQMARYALAQREPLLSGAPCGGATSMGPSPPAGPASLASPAPSVLDAGHSWHHQAQELQQHSQMAQLQRHFQMAQQQQQQQ